MEGFLELFGEYDVVGAFWVNIQLTFWAAIWSLVLGTILAGLASTDANKGQFKVVGNTFSEEKYGVGIQKGSDKCEDINAAIEKMIEDGAWEEAIKKNTEGADYTFNAELNPPAMDACA